MSDSEFRILTLLTTRLQMTYENKSMNEKLAKNHITLLTKRYGKKKKRHEHYYHKAMTQNTNKTT